MSFMEKLMLVWDLELLWNKNPFRAEGLFSPSVIPKPGGMLVLPEGLLKYLCPGPTPTVFYFIHLWRNQDIEVF